MSMTPIEDNEELYRRVRFDPSDHRYYSFENGNVVIGELAFDDSGREPSLDRARINHHNPEKTRKNRSDVVVSVISGPIRKIQIPRTDEHSQVALPYVIDIFPDPTPDNLAHVEIRGNPHLNKRAFRVLRRALKEMATIVLPPIDTANP